MASPESLRYFAFGIATVVTMYFYVASDHLWKKEFFRNCLLVGVSLSVIGILIDVFRIVDTRFGLALGWMSWPIIYLGYFWLFRYFFKRKHGMEPYITSASSSVGAPLFDISSPAFKDGEKHKYLKNRRIIADDFAFSLLQALAPPFTVIALVAFIWKLSD